MTKVGIILGSKSDMEIARVAVNTLKEFAVDFDIIISSAHRTPDRTSAWVKNAKKNNIEIIIAIAGAAAHLGGVVASKTLLPVIAVPVASTALCGFDALLSSVQMPGGIPVATMAIGTAGAKNAALFACQIAALNDETLNKKLLIHRDRMKEQVVQDSENILKNIK